MRVVLKGVHTVKRRLADGSVRVHHYAWRGGPSLPGAPGSPEFMKAYAEAVKEVKEPPKGTMFTLISKYRASGEYGGLAERTRMDYARYLRMIEDEFGTMPIKALEDKRARADFKEWRDGMLATRRKADMAWTVLARVLSWAKDSGLIGVNVCERGGRVYRTDRSDMIWSEDDIGRALASFPEHLRQALILALWTAQRQGDLLRLTWSAYDGRAIRLKQSKTGARVTIPVGDVLRQMLDGMERKAVTILTNAAGMPWTEDGFRASWRAAMERAAIEEVRFNDLRGSAITRLALKGCTEAEIASISGHQIGHVGNVIGRYLARSEKLAEAAIVKLERNEN